MLRLLLFLDRDCHYKPQQKSSKLVIGAGREIEIIGSHGMAASDFPAILKMVRCYLKIPQNRNMALFGSPGALLSGGRGTLEATGFG